MDIDAMLREHAAKVVPGKFAGLALGVVIAGERHTHFAGVRRHGEPAPIDAAKKAA